MEKETIFVFNLIGDSAITMEQGDLVLKEMYRKLDLYGKVTLDFEGVKEKSQFFFNVTIGLLMWESGVIPIEKNITCINMYNYDYDTVKKVIENANENKQRYSR